MKIVVLDGYVGNPGDLSWAPLEKLGHLTVYDRTPEHKVIERIGSAEAVFTNKVAITREILTEVPALRFVGVLATGYDIVDVVAASERGVVVTNVPAYSTTSVAQLTIALLLEICHHVGAHSEAVRSGVWSASSDFSFWHYPLIEMAGKTMGIVGFGSIGKATAAIARALGMHVITVDPSPEPELESESLHFVELEELLAEADVISLHCPLTEATRGLIRDSTIARMKTGVVIINTARGGLVVEDDLARALDSGKIAAAGLDVLDVEPPPHNNPLLTAKNCIITPHFAWAPREARYRLLEVATENLARFLEGKPINVVRPRRR